MLVPQILLYSAFLLCLAAIVVRIVRYARQPVHLRWELYPVAHEKNRQAYGGSHYEEPEHWSKPRRPDRAGEFRAMAAEVLLLEGVRRHNRALWRFSLPFHLGIYLVVVWLGLILLRGLTWPAGMALAALRLPIDIAGFAGLALGFCGAAGLLYRRLADPALRAYSAPADLFNIVIWLLYLGWSLGVHLIEGGFTSLAAPAADWLHFRPVDWSWPLAVAMVVGAVLLAYLPLSRMFHFVAKYFLYHDVRWDDRPNPRGGSMERRLERAMDFGAAWRAPHLAGARSWRDAASADLSNTDRSTS